MIKVFNLIGKLLLSTFENLGKITLFFFMSFFWLFKKPFYSKQFLSQFLDIAFYSLPVVGLTTFFSGMVLALQTFSGFDNFNDESTISKIVLTSILRELGPVLAGLMVCGRVGAKMAAEIATMRVTEQIDALEVMGVNSFNYLIFPKIISLMLYPFLITLAMFLGILGGYVASVYAGFSTSFDFIQGIQLDFKVFHVIYAYIKTTLFAFILATIPSYHGFFMKGGALEVGKASNISFVWTSIVIIIINFVVTQLLLA